MIRSEKAVSEVIGMVMILFIMVIVIGAIMLVGVPMIESGKSRARMDVAANSFLSLQNDIEEVVRGPIWVRDHPSGIADCIPLTGIGPSRVTEFELMGGTLSVISNRTNLTNLTSIKNGSNLINLSTGNITYSADEEEIIYENGAVIRKYGSGVPLMISYPLISIYNTGDNSTNLSASNITISIHVINISGKPSSVGGDGKAWAEISLNCYNQTIPPTGSPNSNSTYINITSKYPEAWEAFFDAKLKEALPRTNKSSDTGYNISYNISNPKSPLEVQVYGTNSNRTKKDIFLSIYETRLDVKVR